MLPEQTPAEWKIPACFAYLAIRAILSGFGLTKMQVLEIAKYIAEGIEP